MKEDQKFSRSVSFSPDIIEWLDQEVFEFMKKKKRKATRSELIDHIIRDYKKRREVETNARDHESV